MKRDFSEGARQELLNLVRQVENERISVFTDWAGDRWYDYQDWIGALDIGQFINNVNGYHKTVIDKNNASESDINRIFNNVNQVDESYRASFDDTCDDMESWQQKIHQLSEIIAPANGSFNSVFTGIGLRNMLRTLKQENVQLITERLMRQVGGVIVVDQQSVFDILRQKLSQINQARIQGVVKVLEKLEKSVTDYTALAAWSGKNWDIRVAEAMKWLEGQSEFTSFSGVASHYNDIYVNILNYISEHSNDKDTLAASLFNFGTDKWDLNLIGAESSETLGKIFGSSTFGAYLAKYTTEHTTEYFAKLEAALTSEGSAGFKLKDWENALEDKLEDWGLRADEKLPTEYYDKDGNLIDEKDAPTFYDRQATLGEWKKQAKADINIYDYNYADSNSKGSVTVGEAEAHAGISAGFYVIGADGKSKKFSPGFNGEIGASVTAFEAGWDQQFIGNENLGLNGDVGFTAGKAEATASGTAQIFGEDGKLDFQLGAEAKAEAIAAELEGSVGANLLGGEVGVKGGVNVGIGAHAEAGYTDGVLKLDAGVSVGVGVSLGVEIDIGGMVDTVCDGAEAAWDGFTEGVSDFADNVESGWNTLKDGWNSLWD